ncbi:heme-binding protein 1 [Anolis carolinensis]|uniref:heme-binding protein 1 n=1 Tax=Anolis carolinensis TaxID=28377 RepID=UPI0004629D96|nr:PREDICTED: heme-binding protein 1 [Anolis carolinensis]|eukprot:XP_003221095.2 PREDICTED: heme-binding protein 1 [Anolis carolinensis]
MFGMIKNSLFGSAEVWPCRVLSQGEKDEVSYEERTYEGGKFATVELTEKPFDEARNEAVLKLLKYVGGSNDQGAGMGIMAPICTTVFPEDDGSLQRKVKVLLRIPSQFQTSPPSPTDESIRMEELEEISVYSTQFGGYAKEADYVNYAAKLTSALGDKEAYHKDFYFCNGYDPPMKPYGRRNEVWLVKK